METTTTTTKRTTEIRQLMISNTVISIIFRCKKWELKEKLTVDDPKSPRDSSGTPDLALTVGKRKRELKESLKPYLQWREGICLRTPNCEPAEQ